LVVEAKAPGELAWNPAHIEAALWQARTYGDDLKVNQLAVSDGHMLYATDVVHGEFRGRAFVSLEDPEPPDDLWWLSVMGIVRVYSGSLRGRRRRPRPDDPSTAHSVEDELELGLA